MSPVPMAASGSLQLMPFFRLHDSRYMLYWPQANQAEFKALRVQMAGRSRAPGARCHHGGPGVAGRTAARGRARGGR